jgi:hypothetical protein
MATIKRVRVTAFLQELPAGHAYQDCQGSGSSLSVAIHRAVAQLLKLPLVKGRRLTSLKLTVTVLE